MTKAKHEGERALGHLFANLRGGDPARFLYRHLRRHGPVGAVGPAPCPDCRQGDPMGQQPGPGGPQHATVAAAIPRRRGGHGRIGQRPGLGATQSLPAPSLACHPGCGDRAGFRDLVAACNGARDPGAVAPAPGAPRRSGLRRDHRLTFPST